METISGTEAVQRMRLCSKGKDVHFGIMHLTCDRSANATAETDGKIILDKSSEAKLDYEEQAFWSTQIATAYMYLLWGEYSKYLPSNRNEIDDVDPKVHG